MLLDTIAPTYVKARAEKGRKGLRDTGLLWIMLAVEVRKREREREMKSVAFHRYFYSLTALSKDSIYDTLNSN